MKKENMPNATWSITDIRCRSWISGHHYCE